MLKVEFRKEVALQETRGKIGPNVWTAFPPRELLNMQRAALHFSKIEMVNSRATISCRKSAASCRQASLFRTEGNSKL